MQGKKFYCFNFSNQYLIMKCLSHLLPDCATHLSWVSFLLQLINSMIKSNLGRKDLFIFHFTVHHYGKPRHELEAETTKEYCLLAPSQAQSVTFLIKLRPNCLRTALPTGPSERVNSSTEAPSSQMTRLVLTKSSQITFQ